MQDPGEGVRTKFSKKIVTYFFPVGADLKQIVVDWVRGASRESCFTGTTTPFSRARKWSRTRISASQSMGWSPTFGPMPSRYGRYFRQAFVSAGLPYFNPHSFRDTLVQLGKKLCRTPEEFEAWSKNLGHEQMLTTFRSYGSIDPERQGEADQIPRFRTERREQVGPPDGNGEKARAHLTGINARKACCETASRNRSSGQFNLQQPSVGYQHALPQAQSPTFGRTMVNGQRRLYRFRSHTPNERPASSELIYYASPFCNKCDGGEASPCPPILLLEGAWPRPHRRPLHSARDEPRNKSMSPRGAETAESYNVHDRVARGGGATLTSRRCLGSLLPLALPNRPFRPSSRNRAWKGSCKTII